MKIQIGFRRLMTLVLLLSIATVARSSDNYSTNNALNISNLIFYSGTSAIYPEWNGVVGVYFTQPISWNATNGACNTAMVAIRPADKPIMAAVQAALATGRSVKVYVDDAASIQGICYLRAVQY